MPTVKELKEHLSNWYKDDDVLAYNLWNIEDVLESAKECGVDIDESIANKVLEKVFYKCDSSVGINWDTIEYHIRKLIEQGE